MHAYEVFLIVILSAVFVILSAAKNLMIFLLFLRSFAYAQDDT